MPIFFDPEKLSAEQTERWEIAKAEYDRILEQNAQRLFDSLTPESRKRMVEQLHARGAAEPENLMRHLYAQASLPGNMRESRNSALFSRLLDGKSPLPVPPPKSYGYPWYECIEKAGPFQVEVSGMLTASEDIDPQMPALGMSLIINQERWGLHSVNPAAKKLLTLQEKIVCTDAGTHEDGLQSRQSTYIWPLGLFEAASQAYAQAPEFTIGRGFNPLYVLRPGRVTIQCRRYYANEVTSATRLASILSREASVLNTSTLHLHPTIGATLIRSASPLENLAAARKALQEGGEQSPARHRVEIQEKLLGENLQRYAQDPGYADMVELNTTGWWLFKV